MKPRAVVFDLGKVLLHFDWMRAASKLAKLSKAFFAELYVINEKLIKSKQDSKAHFGP